MIIGKILKPQGIRGELKVEPLVNDPEVFYDFKTITSNNTLFNVKSVRINQGYVYIMFKEIDNRNLAETMRNANLEVTEDQMPDLKEGEYYITDLVGCSLCFEDGERAGKICDVENYGASDILVIKDGSEEVMCPFLDGIFQAVDIKNKKIVLNKQKFLEVTESED